MADSPTATGPSRVKREEAYSIAETEGGYSEGSFREPKTRLASGWLHPSCYPG